MTYISDLAWYSSEMLGSFMSQTKSNENTNTLDIKIQTVKQEKYKYLKRSNVKSDGTA